MALRACGQHRHIFGYAQTGPDRYSNAPFELPEVPGEELVQTLVGTGFVWRNVLPGSDIPAGTVSVPRGPARPDANWRSFTCAADSRHDPLYVGRVLGRFVGTIDWYRRVCRMAPTEEQCQANNGADEEDRRTRFESNVFQVLVGLNAIRREYRDKIRIFVRKSFSIPVPVAALPPGVAPEPAFHLCRSGRLNNTPIYLGRAFFFCSLEPVSVDISLMFGRNGYAIRGYEILRLFAPDVKWVKSSGGEVVPNAVMGGRTRYSEKLYVGRWMRQSTGQWTLGKVWPRRRHMFIGDARSELAIFDYEILVFKRTSRAREYERKMWGE